MNKSCEEHGALVKKRITVSEHQVMQNFFVEFKFVKHQFVESHTEVV